VTLEKGDLEDIFEENPELLMMDEHTNALLGLVYSKGEAICVYDRDTILRNLTAEFANSGSEEPDLDAEEWIEFNIEGAYLGTQTPLICEPISLDARLWLKERRR